MGTMTVTKTADKFRPSRYLTNIGTKRILRELNPQNSTSFLIKSIPYSVKTSLCTGEILMWNTYLERNNEGKFTAIFSGFLKHRWLWKPISIKIISLADLDIQQSNSVVE